MCACVPPPPHWIARHSPKARKNAGAWSFKENMLYAGGVRVLGASMVIVARGEGVNVFLCPPPPRQIAC
jgi:hypothetical protein